MKITGIDTALYSYPLSTPIADAARTILSRDVLTVSLETDAGVVGMGFLTGHNTPVGRDLPILKHMIDGIFAYVIVGEDPFCYQRIWTKLFEATDRLGAMGAAIRALSGIDLAVWDVMGKVRDEPLHKMVGAFGDRAPAYASGGFYADDADTGRLEEEVASYSAEGFRHIKMKVGRLPVADELARIERVRRAIDDDMGLLLDANGAWDLVTAIQICGQLDEFNVLWVEEPIPMSNVDGYRKLAAVSPVPLALGENCYTRYGFREFLSEGIVSFVQPDVTRMGGITEWLRVHAMASAWDIQCAPHGIQEVHVHLVAGLPNMFAVEYFSPEHPLQHFVSALFQEPAETRQVKDGYLDVPTRPGLGLKLDSEIAARYQIA